MNNFSTSSKGCIFLVLSFAVIIFPICTNFFKYYYAKNYDYIIEAKCDPLIEICFSRDCTNPNDCPPNGLAIYKKFYVKAYDFAKCRENFCEKECNKNLIKCTPIPCGQLADDVCTQLHYEKRI